MLRTPKNPKFEHVVCIVSILTYGGGQLSIHFQIF